MDEQSKKRVRLAYELNAAEANTDLTRKRLALAQQNADKLVEYEQSKSAAIEEARTKALHAPAADRVKLVEEFNATLADAARNDETAHKIRSELGTATVEHEKASMFLQHARTAFQAVLGAPSEIDEQQRVIDETRATSTAEAAE